MIPSISNYNIKQNFPAKLSDNFVDFDRNIFSFYFTSTIFNEILTLISDVAMNCI